jgi:propionyl-CoA carboxylase alpha chain
VRVDTGVMEGGEISMYYDSMIAKLITCGKDRNEAIHRMREALNAFLIRGISSNTGFQAALLAHPRFLSGQFNTGFIAEQYPKGFTLDAVTHPDPDFLVALAAAAHVRLRERASRITGQLPGHEVRLGSEYVVVRQGADGQRSEVPVTTQREGDVIVVGVNGRQRRITLRGAIRDAVVTGEADGQPFCAQVERVGLEYHVLQYGARLRARVLSPRGAELQALMPYKAPPDLSKFLLSPMPGLLVDVAVQAGQQVRAGEKLAVIEAMKMENILVSAQDCVVAEVVAKKGESLAVDQVIVKFQ